MSATIVARAISRELPNCEMPLSCASSFIHATYSASLDAFTHAATVIARVLVLAAIASAIGRYLGVMFRLQIPATRGPPAREVAPLNTTSTRCVPRGSASTCQHVQGMHAKCNRKPCGRCFRPACMSTSVLLGFCTHCQHSIGILKDSGSHVCGSALDERARLLNVGVAIWLIQSRIAHPPRHPLPHTHTPTTY